MNLAIFVDMDETLVHTATRKALLSRMSARESAKHVFDLPPEIWWLSNDAVAVRRHAHEFLSLLNMITPDVYVYTAGLRGYQTRVLQAAKLLPYFAAVFGRGDRTPCCKHAILIDNVCPNNPKIDELLKCCAVVDYICVNDFSGDQDDELVIAARTVKGLVQ